MTASAYQIASLLEKMESPDKDFRFMATSDLMTELVKNNLKLDEDSERKVVRKLLKLLEDKNGEVQNLAVKCLGTVTNRVRENQTEVIVDNLCNTMVTKKDEVRDVASIALKTVVAEFSPTIQYTSNVVKKLVPLLTKALADPSTDVTVRMEMLDVVGDVLFRFGTVVTAYHSELKDVLLSLLSSDRQAIRKKATIALRYLCSSCVTDIYTTIVKYLLEKLSLARDVNTTRTMVTAITFVAKASGSRFSEHIPAVTPLLIKFSKNSDDDELKESVVQALETLILRCPREVAPFISEIEKLVREYLLHDPNYCGEIEEDDDESMETSDEEEEEEDYSDDDDMSWKVRRAAAKAIEALIISRRDQLLVSIKTICPILISRMKEREENVRSDIFGAYIAMLAQVAIVIPNALDELARTGEPSVSIGTARFVVGALSDDQIALLKAIDEQVPSLVKACTRLLRNKSPRTRLMCYELLTQLVRTLPGALSSHFGSVIPGVTSTLSDKTSSSQIRIDLLQFFALAISSHDATSLAPHLGAMVPLITDAISDNFYKVSSEALSVSTIAIPILAHCGDSDLIGQLYQATLPKLKAADIDQEVKEKAITTGGLFAASCGNKMGDSLPECLSILFERCKNEMTRIVAIKAIDTVARSPLDIDLGVENLQNIFPLLADFLKKNIRALKIATLSFVETLLSNYKYEGLDGEGLNQVLSEIANLVRDDDLLVSQLSLKSFGLAIERYPERVAPYLNVVLSGFGYLTQSSLLQGPILQAALEMIGALVVNPVPGKPCFATLLDQLTAPVYDVPNLPKQSFHAISAATAVVASAAGDIGKTRLLCSKLAEQLANKNSTDAIRLFSLMSLGEMGRRCPDVYSQTDIKPEQLIVEAFNSNNEDLKAAAAHALGGMAVGHLNKFLPFILKQMTESKRQYLLLHAIKEIILWETSDGSSIESFRAHIKEIWPVLLTHAECAEEGTRNVVAECIGKLCVLEPQLLHQLKDQVSSSSPNVRAAVVTSIKFMIGPEKRPIDVELSKLIADFLSAVHDDDLNVRRVAFVALNSAAHNKPVLVRHLLDKLMPQVYLETKIRKELVKEVEMGPFKHQVDDGLDLRKAAFECMFTLLESCLEKLDIFEYLTHLEDGLRDHHDIRLLSYITLSKLAVLTPTHVLQRLEKVCEPLKQQLNSKVKSNAVKQEIEKHDELKRTAIRTWLALQEIPDAARQPQLVDIQNTVRSTPELKAMLAAVERDSQRTFTNDMHMEVA